ncbi:uncharacterized protein LOC141732247 isoform X1 [Larus michahellis]|uniref:uncharacterized protein LOC141732247 isoform X1 n=1 Tax=Larus michahellis TaxID=119627 RepID=UPI003D9AF745
MATALGRMRGRIGQSRRGRRSPIGRVSSPRRGPAAIDGGERPLELSCLGAERAMANGRAAWAGRRRRRVAPLRKRRGPGENGVPVAAGAGRPGGKAGPVGRAASSERPRARGEASGAREGSPSASREETPARLIPLAAQSVNWQRFSAVALLLCGDSAGPMERIWSAQRVRGFDPSLSAASTQRGR